MKVLIIGLIGAEAMNTACFGKGYAGVDSDGSCLCAEGYEKNGESCDEIPQCKQGNNPCDITSTDCKPALNGPQCTCKQGFEVIEDDFTTCRDINECDNDRDIEQCSFGQVCHNLPGTFECRDKDCDAGMELDYGVCVDIDECFDGTHKCGEHSRCRNTDSYDDTKNGGYDCICDNGFQLDTDGVTCVDVDECTTGQHQCKMATDFRGNLPDMESQLTVTCQNTVGDYECLCPPDHEELDRECHAVVELESTTTVTTPIQQGPSELSGTTTAATGLSDDNFLEANMIVIFAVGGAVFVLLAIGIILCCIKCRKRIPQEQNYTSATLQKLDSTDDHQAMARAESFETLDSVEVEEIPLSKFEASRTGKSTKSNNFPAPPADLQNSPAIVRGGPHSQSVANQNYAQVTPGSFR